MKWVKVRPSRIQTFVVSSCCDGAHEAHDIGPFLSSFDVAFQRPIFEVLCGCPEYALASLYPCKCNFDTRTIRRSILSKRWKDFCPPSVARLWMSARHRTRARCYTCFRSTPDGQPLSNHSALKDVQSGLVLLSRLRACDSRVLCRAETCYLGLEATHALASPKRALCLQDRAFSVYVKQVMGC